MVETIHYPSPGGHKDRVTGPCRKRHGKDPCDACNTLKFIDQHIQSAVDVLKGTLKLYQEALGAMNRKHNPTLYKLTDEILSRIFLFCIPGVVPSENCLKLSAVERSAPLVLGLVCRRWRQVSQTTPSLWTQVIVSIDARKSSFSSDILMDWLRRSKDLRLTIIMSGATRFPMDYSAYSLAVPHINRIIDVLVQYADRWYHLDLDIPMASFDHLEKGRHVFRNLSTLRLKSLDSGGLNNYIKFQGGCYPTKSSPRHVSIRSPSILRAVGINWHNVTFIDVPFNMEDCLELIRQAPRLQDCRLRGTRGEQDANMSQARLTFSNLEKLSIAKGRVDVDLFFNYIICGSLKRFTWKSPMLPRSSGMLFLQRSFGSLEELNIECYECDDDALIKFLKIFDKLPRLELRRSRHPGTIIWDRLDCFFKALAARSTGQTLLPNLVDFTYTTDCFFPTWKFVPRIFGEFSTGARSLIRSKLRPGMNSLTINLLEIDTQDLVRGIDRQTLLEIIAVQKSGSKIQILNNGRDTSILGLSMKRHGLKVV